MSAISLTPAQHEARQAYLETLETKAENLPRFYGILGDGSGNVDVDGRPGWVYVRLPALKNIVVAALNAKVSSTDGLPVVVGYTNEHPNLLQVLTVDFSDAVIMGGNGEQIPNANIPTHHHTHEWRGLNGGNDVVIVQSRQIAPLRPVITTGFSLTIERGLCPVDNGWVQVEQTSLDLTATLAEVVLKDNEGYYILVYVDREGTLTYTRGKKRPMGILTYRDLPFPPFGGFAICGLRCYQGQTSFQDNETVTDLVDLRFAQPNHYNALVRLVDALGASLTRILGIHITQG